MPSDTAAINEFLQRELELRGFDEAPAVEAARWLGAARILSDSAARPGRPLRDLLRAGKIVGAEQRPPTPNGRWFISRIGVNSQAVRPPATPLVPTPQAGMRATASDPASLGGEVHRAVALLSRARPPEAAVALPDDPGLYTFWPKNTRALEDLRLADSAGHESLAARVLYLGKAEDSIRVRVANTHLKPGKTGHSTVRRTLAALLGLRPIPRPSGIAKPTRSQLMQATANFGIEAADEEHLTTWMLANLELRTAASGWRPLETLERKVGAALKPPLDQERSPMWGPNPWRAMVTDARQSMRDSLRRELGLR
jgi:hypothetical protein